MLPTSRLRLDTDRRSPYAAAQQPGLGAAGFAPTLELEYQRNRLLHGRALLRATSALAILVMSLRGLEQSVRAPHNSVFLLGFALVLLVSAALAAIAWSPLFERFYVPWARIVVPLRNVIVVAPIVDAAARGHVEALMALPVMLFGSFFFFGLRLPAAIVSGLLLLVAFIVCAVCFQVGLPLALRSGAFLVVAVIGCVMAARHLDLWSRASFLEERRIADLAQHDALTGTKNRRVFDEHLVRLWHQAIEDERAIAILLIDVDHFKAYNDRYGHLAGDQALRRIAQTAQRFIRRPLDILARYGGEEFVAILYDMEIEQARELGNRICRAVAELGIEHHESDEFAVVTISAGIAALRPTIERDPRGAVQLADQALYEAKLSGRNRIHVMEDADHRAMVTGAFAVPFREASR